jgi:hypothetical protein
VNQPAVKSRAFWVFLAAACLTAIVYWPSLHGGYIFDDTVYFIENTDVHVTTLRLGDWIRAALDQAGTNQFRALSMLSFAANYYFTGLDPFWPKLTNLCIHLVNGFLLFLLLREALRLRQQSGLAQQSQASGISVAAAMIAGAWLLLPINLTGVAYVAQRMESLANVFVFLGLFWYLRVRRREYAQGRTGIGLPASIFACMLLGLTAKESAVLLPLYTACAELALTRFRNADGKFSRPALLTHALLLALPLVAGLAWISTWIFRGTATFRTFSIGERLLTEPRVLADYIGWTLLPNINSLTFYHDDLTVSHGLLDPPTTLAAIIALLALLGLALWQRRTRPLFCLGILWFFAGHALTATVIPLELVFEHRNYFPSAGLLLSAASLIALEPGLRMPLARNAIVAGFLALFAFTTFLRAEEWSDPIRLAYAEALKRPDSPRAQYDLARTLIIAAGKDQKSPLIDKSIAILERNAYRPDSGIAPLQALIYLNGRAHRNIDPRWWQAITQRLHSRTPTQTDISSVIFLFRCQQHGECPDQPQELLNAFVAALTTTAGDANLMSAYADFAVMRLGDPELAVRMSRQVVASNPRVPVYRGNLVKMLIRTGRFDDAQTEIERLRSFDRGGSQKSTIAELEAALATARSQKPRAPPAPTVPVDPSSR